MIDRFREIFAEGVLSGTISGLRSIGRSAESNPEQPRKVRIHPFLSKGQTTYQFSYTIQNREVHQNFNAEQAAEETDRLLREVFTQAVFNTTAADWHAFTLGKGKLHKKPPSKQSAAPQSHNRKKPSILEEHADFLIRLGVSSAEGTILKGKNDKFRQINKYLELIAGMIPKTDGRPLRVIDFGCGKAYLTFALYYYLTKVLHLPCQVTGLDLKTDVIDFCNGVARDLGYEHLQFHHGDIADWKQDGPVDMVVTLHACDTATDAAIAKAVSWGASTIITVPCCQHELFSQIHSDNQLPLLRHGILKERIAALVTDAARAQLLEAIGYKVDVIEFIDMEHTPKNIMIRASKKGGESKKALEAYHTFANSWNISPCLERLLSLD